MAITLTLHNEAARDALARAAWRILAHPVEGSSLDSEIWDAACVEYDEEQVADARELVDERLRAIGHIRDQVELIEQSSAARISVDLDAERLAYELKNLRDGVEEGEDRFFNASSENRNRMLALYDAAGVLMESLPEPKCGRWGEAPAEAMA